MEGHYRISTAADEYLGLLHAVFGPALQKCEDRGADTADHWKRPFLQQVFSEHLHSLRFPAQMKQGERKNAKMIAP